MQVPCVELADAVTLVTAITLVTRTVADTAFVTVVVMGDEVAELAAIVVDTAALILVDRT